VKSPARSRPCLPPRSAFAGFRFPAEAIVVALRWYLRYGLSYRDVEELLAERGIDVDHVTVYRWVQRFTPLLADAARFARHSPGDRWFVDETYVRSTACGATSTGRSTSTARSSTCCSRSTETPRPPAGSSPGRCALKVIPREVITDAAPVYPAVLEEQVPAAWHHVEQYANNPIEADHGQLKRRLRPMRGLQTDRTAQVVIAGRAFLQNLRRGHYELGIEARSALRVAAAFTELTQAI
jgi:transposase-like protein